MSMRPNYRRNVVRLRKMGVPRFEQLMVTIPKPLLLNELPEWRAGDDVTIEAADSETVVIRRVRR